MVVIRDDCLVPVLPDDGQIAEIIGDDDLLVIDTLFDENSGMEIGIKSPH